MTVQPKAGRWMKQAYFAKSVYILRPSSLGLDGGGVQCTRPGGKMNPAHQTSSSRSQIGLVCIANTEQPFPFLIEDFPLVRFSPGSIIHLLSSYTDAVVGLVKCSLCSLRAVSQRAGWWGDGRKWHFRDRKQDVMGKNMRFNGKTSKKVAAVVCCSVKKSYLCTPIIIKRAQMCLRDSCG